MSFTIKKIERKDLAHVLGLMADFARYEKLDSFLEVTEDRLASAMFGSDAFVEGLIAFDGDEPLGYAIFYPIFLTFRGQRGYLLEDLVVSERNMRMDRVEWKASKGTIRVHNARLLTILQRALPGGEFHGAPAARFLITQSQGHVNDEKEAQTDAETIFKFPPFNCQKPVNYPPCP